jgi:hypothetical protein
MIVQNAVLYIKKKRRKMPRIKSERELKWEQEHAAEIEESIRLLKEQNKKEWADKKKIKDEKPKK